MKWYYWTKSLSYRAKKAIAGFKIREGMPIGCTVTLRGDRMFPLRKIINWPCQELETLES